MGFPRRLSVKDLAIENHNRWEFRC